MKKLFAATILCAALTLSSCHKISEETSGSGDDVSYTDSTQEEFVSPVYESLSDDEKELYVKVRDAVADFKETVSFDPPVSRDEAKKLYRLVYAQERKYFWLSSLFYAPDSEVSVLRLNYLYGREDAEIKRTELDLAASTIIGELPDDASDFDRIVYFHDRIIAGCTFSTEEEHVNSAYGVLVTGYGQCEGYAAAMAMLCDKVGIPNYIVTGSNSEGESHAWNKVYAGGSWYNVDCTWDDPIITKGSKDFIRHDYLMVKDSEIEGKSHFTDGLYAGLTSCESGELNYFAVKGLTFDTAAEGVEVFAEQIKTAGLSGKREAEIRFSNENAYYAAMARLFDSGEAKDIIEDVNGKYGTRIRSAYKHNNDDMLIVHISLIYESDSEEQAERSS